MCTLHYVDRMNQKRMNTYIPSLEASYDCIIKVKWPIGCSKNKNCLVCFHSFVCILFYYHSLSMHRFTLYCHNIFTCIYHKRSNLNSQTQVAMMDLQLQTRLHALHPWWFHQSKVLMYLSSFRRVLC